MTRCVKWVEWKIVDPEKTLNMFRYLHKEYLVPGIEEDKTSKSEPEDNPEEKFHVHVIPDEG